MWVRMVGAALFLFAIYEVVSLASHSVGTAPPPAASRAIDADPVPGRPPGRTHVQRAFLNDFAHHLRTYRDYIIEVEEKNRTVQLNVQRVLNFESNADFFAVYVPGSSLSFNILVHIAEDWDNFMEWFRDVTITRQEMGDVNRFGGEDLRFSNLIYFYSENIFSIEEMADLRRMFKEKGITVQFKHPGTLRSARDDL
jgi:hypothetical protein